MQPNGGFRRCPPHLLKLSILLAPRRRSAAGRPRRSCHRSKRSEVRQVFSQVLRPGAYPSSRYCFSRAFDVACQTATDPGIPLAAGNTACEWVFVVGAQIHRGTNNEVLRSCASSAVSRDTVRTPLDEQSSQFRGPGQLIHSWPSAGRVRCQCDLREPADRATKEDIRYDREGHRGKQ